MRESVLSAMNNLPVENGAKALCSLTISGLAYQRSGINEDAFTYTFSPVNYFSQLLAV